MRRQALDIFINRIASHPELKESEDLRIFLQEDEEVKLSYSEFSEFDKLSYTCITNNLLQYCIHLMVSDFSQVVLTL